MSKHLTWNNCKFTTSINQCAVALISFICIGSLKIYSYNIECLDGITIRTVKSGASWNTSDMYFVYWCGTGTNASIFNIVESNQRTKSVHLNRTIFCFALTVCSRQKATSSAQFTLLLWWNKNIVQRITVICVYDIQKFP